MFMLQFAEAAKCEVDQPAVSLLARWTCSVPNARSAANVDHPRQWLGICSWMGLELLVFSLVYMLGLDLDL